METLTFLSLTCKMYSFVRAPLFLIFFWLLGKGITLFLSDPTQWKVPSKWYSDKGCLKITFYFIVISDLQKSCEDSTQKDQNTQFSHCYHPVSPWYIWRRCHTEKLSLARFYELWTPYFIWIDEIIFNLEKTFLAPEIRILEYQSVYSYCSKVIHVPS